MPSKMVADRMCKVVWLLMICIFPLLLTAQQLNNPGEIEESDTANKVDLVDIANKVFKVSPSKIARRKGKKIYFSLLPTSSPIPGGGNALITSTRAGFYLGKRKNTYLSNVTFVPYLNFKGRYSIAFKSDIYTSQNKWNIQGDTRFSVFPEYVYGPQKSEYKNEKLLITYKYIRFYQTVLKRLKPYFLAGMGYNLDYHVGIKTLQDTMSLKNFTGYPYGTEAAGNTFSSGITFNFLYDSRNNTINPLPGSYINFIYRLNPVWLGNGSGNWRSVFLDTRKYMALPGTKRHMVAVWNYVWSALSNDVPFLDLPGIGYEPSQRSGRGIEQNRYRGKSLIYLEGEYRSDITQNGLLGYVVFANFNMVSAADGGALSGPHPAAGAGLRIKFNKRSNTNIAADVGFSKGHSGISLALGEAF